MSKFRVLYAIFLLSLLLMALQIPSGSQAVTAAQGEPPRAFDASHYEQKSIGDRVITPSPAVDESLGLVTTQIKPEPNLDLLEFEVNSGSFVIDNFNRPDGPIGHGWTVHDGSCNISGNTAVCGGEPGQATFNNAFTDGNMAEIDVAAVGTSLQYAGLLLNYGAGETNLFIKVQQQSPYEGKFTHAACYTGSGSGSFGLGFFELTSSFTTAHMSARRVGKTLTLVFSNVDGGTQPTQTYICTGAPPEEGTGIGILGFNSTARMDNFGYSQKQILLVDDDWDFDITVPNDGGRPYYTTALDTLGYSYVVWDTVTQGNPSAADMLPYSSVIWFTGYDWDEPITPENETALAAYLDSGGNLILSSLDYYYAAGTITPFMRDYLGVSDFVQDFPELDPIGNNDSPVGVNLGPYVLQRPDNWAIYWPIGTSQGPYNDYVFPNPAIEAPFKFNASSMPNSTAYDSRIFQTVFLGWPFEWVADLNDRAEILGSMLGWGHWVEKPTPCFDLTRFDGEYFPQTGLIYVLGGRPDSGTTDGNIYTYNPMTGACSDTGTDMPTPISNYTVNLINDGTKDLLCTFGGRIALGGTTQAVQCYDPISNTASIVAALPGAYSGYNPGAQVVYNNRVYVFGGLNTSTEPYNLSITYRYNPITKSFSPLGNLSMARSYIYAAEVDGKIYAFGGTTYNGVDLQTYTRAEVMSNPEGAGTWSDAAVPDLPSPYAEGQAFGFDSTGMHDLAGKVVFVGGGVWPNETSDAWTFDTLSNTYDASFPDLQTPRRDHAGVFVPRDTLNKADGLPGLWVFGGRFGSDYPPYAGVEYFPLNFNSSYVFLPLIMK